MSNVTWKNPASADWTVASAWTGNAVPDAGADVFIPGSGSYRVTIATPEAVVARSLVLDGTLAVEGTLQLAQASTISPGANLAGGGVIAGAALLINNGLVSSTEANGLLEIETAGFTNAGSIVAGNGGVVAIFAQDFTNLSGGTLSGGALEADGALAAIDIFNAGGASTPLITDNATLTLNGSGAEIFSYDSVGKGYSDIDATLTTVGALGVLNILGGRDYGTANALSLGGLLVLGGGSLSAAAGITNKGGATIRGFGRITTAIGNGGRIEAQGGVLTLAGGITDTGALTIDAGATLAFAGTYSQPVLNNGTMQAVGGTLKLAGSQGGTGGYMIQAGATLELAAAAAGGVSFNGVGASLVLDSPGGFTGGVRGFGAGNTIDVAGVAADGASIANGRLTLSYGGSPVYSVALAGSYASASVAVQSDGASGTAVTVGGVAGQSYVLEGPSWNVKTITWSLAAGSYPTAFDIGHPFSSLIDAVGQAAYVGVIRQALQAWTAVSGISFVQVPDAPQQVGAADLRLGWGNLLGTGGEIGQATFRSVGNMFQQDVIIRLEDPALDPLVGAPGVIGGLAYSGTASTFYQVVLHEIGHALGLGHSSDPGAVMYPVAGGSANQVLDASDIAGIQALDVNAACYARGTRILTARGQIPVERLVVGELVPGLLCGRMLQIRWLGRRSFVPARHRRPQDLQPILVEAGAFGDGRPHRDLLLSPDHAVFAGGALIPIRYLLNGASVRWTVRQRIEYWHVELQAEDGGPVHDIVLADGLEAESYLDTGNRPAFAAAGIALLRPGLADPDIAMACWAERGCAPLHVEGPAVVAQRRLLAARAGLLGHVRTAEPDLHVVSREKPYRAVCRAAGQLGFDLPGGRVTLRSRSFVPAEMGQVARDHRRLGVAVGSLRLDGVVLPLDGACIAGGFHPIEHAAGGAWRWTDGCATIDLPAAGRLDVTLRCRGEYWTSDVTETTPGRMTFG